MPQAARKDPVNQRAQDKELKRARGALSCAECRRLKLKCDKTVPCSSCKRRGCSSICPNGVLITGQGTRFVLADTEKLHEKIAVMSDRIRQLEDALTILHSGTGDVEPHPLLNRESLKIKSSLELHSAVQSEDRVKEEELEESQYIDAFGTLAIREDGASTFYGRSAGSESLLIGEPVAAPQETHHSSHDPHSPLHLNGHSSPTIQDWQQQAAQSHGLPSVLANLSHSFPLPTSHAVPDLDFLIKSYLPSYHEASRLCELYLEQAPWFFGAVTKRQLYEEMLPSWYAEAPRPPVVPSLDVGGSVSADRKSSSPRSGPSVGTVNTSSPLGTHSNPPVDISSGSHTSGLPNGKSRTAHDLALFFMILCFGALTDENLPAAPDNVQSERYYDLTKIGLNLEGILDRPPSVATVQTLSLMGIYEGMRNKENSIESTWALMGMATKLAQSIGLHRDCARWGLHPAEVQKRRALFWELFITDCWQSLATGRLATFSLPFVDCELPLDPDQTISEDGTIQPSFPFWKARFGAECVSAVVQGTLTSRAPKYSIILDLDRKVRDMAVPKYAQGPIPESAGLNQTMSHCMPVNYRELTLIYIHRCFFTHAIQSSPMDPIKSQYAPSFLAGYRSACDLLEAVRKQFNKFPAQIARFWVLWTHAFSSTVMISSVVTHGSRSKVAPAALLELKSAYELFREASNHGGRAIKFLPIVQRLLDKAQKVFFETSSGVPPSVPNDIFSPSGSAPDEISVFSGKTHTVTTKVNRVSNHRSPSNGTSRGSESPSGSPAQNFTTANPSFAGVHPSLVQELNGFDGHIAAQLQNAYNNHHEDFNEVLMGARVSQQQQQQRYQTEQLAHQQYENQQQRELEEQQRLQRNMIEEQMIRQREEERQRAAEEDAYAQAQARHHHPTLHYTYDGSPTAESSLSIAHGVPMPAPVQDEPMQDQRRTLAHSHSHPNLHRDYDQAPHAGPSNRFRYDSVAPPGSHVRRQQSPARQSQPRQQHRSTNSRSQHPHPHSRQHPHQHPRQHPPPSPHSHQAHPPPPQHEMYAIPPGYMSNHHSPSSSDIAVSPTSSTHSHAYPSPETVFNSPVVQGAYWSNGHHASAAPEGVVYTDHPPPSRQPLVGPPHHQQHPQYYSIPRTTPVSHLPQYTPEAAMQGMAAEDPRLQETWQSYMSNVTSSRLMLDD